MSASQSWKAVLGSARYFKRCNCHQSTFKSHIQPQHYNTGLLPLAPYRCYATSSPTPKSRRVWYFTGAVLIIGTGAIATSDDARHALEATRRAARVGGALLLSINDYRRTLKLKNDPDIDQETYALRLKECHKRSALRTLRVCEKNGSIFIKLGQHLSSLNYLLPREWCETFIPLQDKCPVSLFESIQAMVAADTGQPMSELFETFDERPIAAASLAQVHLATLAESGERVAVKVQHPGLAEWVKMDLSLTRLSFRTLKRFFPEYDLTWLSEEMDVSLPKELDFELEGANALEVKSYFAKLRNGPPLVIPDVKWSRRRILVMEYLPGHRLDDFAYLDNHHLDKDEIAASLARIMNEMIFGRDAPLHCDTHMGNIAIRARSDALSQPQDGRDVTHASSVPSSTTGGRGAFDIILYDHGLYRHPPAQIRQAYARLWLAILDADEPAMRVAAWDLAGITDAQFPLFAAAITGREYNTLVSHDPVSDQVNSAEDPSHPTSPIETDSKPEFKGNQLTKPTKTKKKSSITSQRTEAESEAISNALLTKDGAMIEQLIQILSRVPRVILLILKTNDLTRSLAEALHTGEAGTVRQFLILARYAARAVYEEEIDGLKSAGDGGTDGAAAAAGVGPGVGVSAQRSRSTSTLGLRKWGIGNVMRLCRARLAYDKVRLQLGLYEWWLWITALMGARVRLGL